MAGPAPPASVVRLQSQNEVPAIKDLDEYLRNKYDREQRRKFAILKTERVDIARGGGLINNCRPPPTHSDHVAQSSSEDSMDSQDVKLGRCSSTMSKRIRLVKRSNSDDTRASTDKTPVSSTDILTEQKRPQKRLKERFFTEKKETQETIDPPLGERLLAQPLEIENPVELKTSNSIVRDAAADDIDIYLITDSDSAEDGDDEEQQGKEGIPSSTFEVEVVKEEVVEEADDETEMLKEIFGISGEDELSAIAKFTSQTKTGSSEENLDLPSTSRTSRSLKDLDSPPTGTLVSLNQTLVAAEKGRLAQVVAEHEATIAAQKQKLSKYKEALVKVDRKLAKKRSDLAKADKKVEELTKENQKLTKRYHKSVDEREEKEKVLEKVNADSAVKQLKIQRLEEMLRRKEELEKSKASGESSQWKSLLLEEKQNQIEDLESLLKGKEESLSAKMETIMTLEVESKSKELQHIQLSSKLEDALGNLAVERKSNEDLRAKNEKLERYMLQKSHTMNQEVAEKIQVLEAKVEKLKAENISLVQNSNVSMIQVLQEKENAVQLARTEFDRRLKDEAAVSSQKVATLELQNFDLISQVQCVPMLQSKVRELEAQLASKTSASARLVSSEQVLVDTPTTTVNSSWVKAPTNQDLPLSSLQGQASENTGRLETSQSGASLSQKSNFLAHQLQSSKAAPPQLEPRADSEVPKTPAICLQKFSSLCSESFNVNQSHWSEGSESETETLTNDLLSLKSVNQANVSLGSNLRPTSNKPSSPLQSTRCREKIKSESPSSDSPSPPRASGSTGLPGEERRIKQEEDKDDACDESLPPEPRKDKATGSLEDSGSKTNTEEHRKIQVKIEDIPEDDDESETNCGSDDLDIHQDKKRQIQELVQRVEKKKQRLEDCRHVRKKKDKKRKEEKKRKRKKERKRRQCSESDSDASAELNDQRAKTKFTKIVLQSPKSPEEAFDNSESESREVRTVSIIREKSVGAPHEDLDVRTVRRRDDDDDKDRGFSDEEEQVKDKDKVKDKGRGFSDEENPEVKAKREAHSGRISSGAAKKVDRQKASLADLIMDKVQERALTEKESGNRVEDRIFADSETTRKLERTEPDEMGIAQMRDKVSIRKEVEKINQKTEDVDLKTRERIIEKGHRVDGLGSSERKQRRSRSRSKSTENESQSKYKKRTHTGQSRSRSRSGGKWKNQSRSGSEDKKWRINVEKRDQRSISRERQRSSEKPSKTRSKSRSGHSKESTFERKGERRRRSKSKERNQTYKSRRGDKRKQSRSQSRSRSREQRRRKSSQIEKIQEIQRRALSKSQNLERGALKQGENRSNVKEGGKAYLPDEKNTGVKLSKACKGEETSYTTIVMCSPTGVEMYYDSLQQCQRVRLDGHGATGPPEVLVNMMAVDPLIKVYFRTACNTCGKDISRASTENHFVSGACCRKTESLASGGVVFCSYCEVMGAHWVQACPLIVSFCFACWVWGHNVLHHQVADEKYLARLMRRFNEMREWHHVNLRSTNKSKTIPSNSLVTSSNKECQITYEGDYDEVLDIANGLPGSSSVPACWLLRRNWKELIPSFSERTFKWVTTDQEELCLIKCDHSETTLEKGHREFEEKTPFRETSGRNPFLPRPPPPLVPHPDFLEECGREEEGKACSSKESEKEMVSIDHCRGEGGCEKETEEEEGANISDWLEY